MKIPRNIIFAIILCLIIGASPVWAREDSENKPSRFGQRREAIQQRTAENRQAFKERREEWQKNVKTRRAQAKERYAAVRDERKKTLVERVQNALDAINDRRTAHFINVLDRLSSILDKILSRAEALGAEEKDVSVVESHAQSAQSAIELAQTAVRTQAAKDYTVVISDEAKTKEIVSTLFKQLQEDIRVVGGLVRTARGEVVKAYQALAEIAGAPKELKISE